MASKKAKGHVPTPILEERLDHLNRIVKARGGKHFEGSPKKKK
jgi:hypothetical protein